MKHNITFLIACSILVFSFACATKKSVTREVERIDQQITTIASDIETQEARIQEHDSRMVAHDQKITKLSRESLEAMERAIAAEKIANGKLLYEVTLTDDSTKFEFDKANIPQSHKESLDELISRLKIENLNIYIEVQGHTDWVGPDEYNYRLGLERAESVRRYLSDSGIPLHKISVISYGEERPLADNNSREGRGQNRRVVIQVLT